MQGPIRKGQHMHTPPLIASLKKRQQLFSYYRKMTRAGLSPCRLFSAYAAEAARYRAAISIFSPASFHAFSHLLASTLGRAHAAAAMSPCTPEISTIPASRAMPEFPLPFLHAARSVLYRLRFTMPKAPRQCLIARLHDKIAFDHRALPFSRPRFGARCTSPICHALYR